jgi:predicted nucleic acid-binding protein
LANRKDPDHKRVRRVFDVDGGPYLVPAGALAEMTFLIEERLGLPALDAFLSNLSDRALSLDCGEDDFPRIRELATRYRDLPLGAVDASVVACAERNGGRVLTLDRRDFDVVGREGKLVIEPQVGDA